MASAAYLSALAAAFVAGCSEDSKSPLRAEQGSSGRYVITAAGNDFPPLLLDTQTGCLRAVVNYGARVMALMELEKRGVIKPEHARELGLLRAENLAPKANRPVSSNYVFFDVVDGGGKPSCDVASTETRAMGTSK